LLVCALAIAFVPAIASTLPCAFDWRCRPEAVVRVEIGGSNS
jgi:hypothetical protein